MSFSSWGSRSVAIFNFESTESASFLFHSKLRDRKWRKSEGMTIVLLPFLNKLPLLSRSYLAFKRTLA